MFLAGVISRVKRGLRMAWDEWEQIKTEVTGRQTVAMRLNHVPMEPPTGPSAITGGLKSSRKAWVTAGKGWARCAGASAPR